MARQQTDENTVFERRGFMQSEAPEPEVEAPKEVTPEEADEIAGEMAPAVPEQGAPPPADGNAADVPEEGEPEKKAAAKIRIGSREFTSTEEAWAYAQELEQEKIAADAFRHGVETAAKEQRGNPPPEAAQPDPDEKFEEEFYANPKEYLRKVRQQVKDEVKTEIRQAQTVEEKNKQTWSEFYTEYPDLTNAQELVQLTLQQNWNDLSQVETKKALKIIAEKTRDKRKAMLADLLPGQELPRTKTAASPGGGVRVTPQKVEEKNLTLVQQMSKIKRERAAKAQR